MSIPHDDFLPTLLYSNIKFEGGPNCKLRRYFRNSDSVIYQSKLLSSSSSMPCILSIITHLINSGIPD